MRSRIQQSQKLPEPCLRAMCCWAHGYKSVHETEQQECLSAGLHQPPSWLHNHVGIFWGSTILAPWDSQGSGGHHPVDSEQGLPQASLSLNFPISEATLMSPHCPPTSQESLSDSLISSGRSWSGSCAHTLQGGPAHENGKSDWRAQVWMLCPGLGTLPMSVSVVGSFLGHVMTGHPASSMRGCHRFTGLSRVLCKHHGTIKIESAGGQGHAQKGTHLPAPGTAKTSHPVLGCRAPRK